MPRPRHGTMTAQDAAALTALVYRVAVRRVDGFAAVEIAEQVVWVLHCLLRAHEAAQRAARAGGE